MTPPGHPVSGQCRRTAGVLLHVTSLPGPFGIGDLGPASLRWIDILSRAGQTWWQVLPLGPPGCGNSPYQCFSAFAGNSDLISPEMLVKDGLITRADLVEARCGRAGVVEYGRVIPRKARLIGHAWERFAASARHHLRAAFAEFCDAEDQWLDDYALFMAIGQSLAKPWTQWPRDLRFRRPASLSEARLEFAEAVDRHRFAQFLFNRQLNSLRRHAKSRGVKLIGDLPIYVSGDSADVWANPHLFLLDRDLRPKAIAGVPPDLFSRTGQCWGNPLYDWAAARREKYAWWVRRFRAALRQVDLVRVDHFRGFAGYWKIPAGHRTAVKGKWVRGPGAELFDALRDQLGGLPVIAEDLGLITPDVHALRDHFGLPGMRVMQFAFGGRDNPHLPHNYIPNCVAYTGTHDNDTTAGWYASITSAQRHQVQAYAGDMDADPARALTRAVWSSVAKLAVVPLQDIFGLGSSARMNYPGRAEGNWRWRATEAQLTQRSLDDLAELTSICDRSSLHSRRQR